MYEIMSKSEAARILGVSEKTIERYVRKGLLRKLAGQSNNVFARDVGKLLLRKKIPDTVMQEIYTMSALGVSLSVLCHEFSDLGYWPCQMVAALSIYSQERRAFLNSFPGNNVLLGTEVSARLRLRNRHVLEELLETRALEPIVSRKGSREICFVSKESLLHYLGPYYDKRLYRSHHAKIILEKLGCEVTINRIDKLAKKYRVGFKIFPEKKNSAYLFSYEDILQLYAIYQQIREK